MINTRGVWTVKKQLIDNKAQKIDIDPDTLNNYYCSVSNESTLTPCPSKPPNFPFSSKSTFTFKPVDYKILISQFRKLKNSSKTQPDITGLSPLMLKLTIGSPNVISGILNIINKSLLESQFPENLKTSVITPIPKQNDATEPIHFRPVAAQPFLSLLIEKCAHNQIMTYLSEHNILYQGQFGFRPFHSCETAMIALIDSVHNQINLGNICILVSLDLSKAFDVLVREFLLEKLRWYGIDPKWFSAYLSYRSQVVKGANGKLSHVKFTIHGCPQGSVIGPLIFCVYVNDLPLVIKNCLTILYADDTQLCIGPPSSLNFLIRKVESDLLAVQNWMVGNGMKINVKKTQLIILGNAHNVAKIGQITINFDGVTITSQSTIKCLGLKIDSKLSWYDHINDLSRKCHFVAKSLHPLRPIISMQNYLKIMNACVISLVNYMVAIWGTAAKKHLRIIESCMRKSARNILGMRKFDPVSDYMHTKLKWLLPQENHFYRINLFIFQVSQRKLPYFNDFLVRSSEIHDHFTRGNDTIRSTVCPKNKSGEKCMNYLAINAWNKLPSCLTGNVNVIIFKRELKKFILENGSILT